MNKIALEVRVARGREIRAMRWGSDEKVQTVARRSSGVHRKNTTTEVSKVQGRGDCNWGARKKELLLEMSQEQLHHKARTIVFVVKRLRH